jgi:hypothetical protein
MKKFILYLAPVLLLTACATAYQPSSFSGGFEETQYSENVWRVSFVGNGYTRSQAAEEMAMLRSAELTVINGYKFFAIVDSRMTNDAIAIPQASTSYTTGSVNSFGTFSGTTRTYGGAPLIVRKPSANNTVMMFKEKPDNGAFVYDANFVCGSIGLKYKVICGHPKK